MEPREKIIVALDVNSLDEAVRLTDLLRCHVGIFKVGLELLTSEGAPRVVTAIQAVGGMVGYDGKFCDIPNTVAGAARAVSRLGVTWFNVHASAGRESIEAAVKNRGNSAVYGVTVLTSIVSEECTSIFGDKPEIKVPQFAASLVKSKAQGIICSPRELEVLRSPEFAGLLKVTPGIRAPNAPPDDQKRTATPAEAIKAGADYLVIGRPITQADDPVVAAQKIADEIASVL